MKHRMWGGASRISAGIATVVSLLGCLGGPTDVEPPPEDVRSILFIGNSLTYENDLPGMLEILMEEGLGEDVYVASEARPNFGLPDHWASGAARELVALGGWELVILQQGPSATEGRPYLLDFTELFAEEIRSAGAEPALYMVWPALARFFDFDGVLDSYRTAAERVDGWFFPAGEAWRVAWETDAELPLYGSDGFHPSVLGTYLAALVMYEQITGLDARALPAVITGAAGSLELDEEVAAALQAAAHEANLRHARRVGA
ncbi:MAG: hypothetical protein AMS19_04935 [Gemmatimonas sp. SG8_23]|nr:MAG: hypothetical protein AMS19_04935 [Gemmatimonas sp. SG8_23]